jgi:hypothetical protein
MIIAAGHSPLDPRLDLDRLLHHEEIHSRQWARDSAFDLEYIVEQMFHPEEENKYEKTAGLSDGGYLPP